MTAEYSSGKRHVIQDFGLRRRTDGSKRKIRQPCWSELF